jgi:hypothetical protein
VAVDVSNPANPALKGQFEAQGGNQAAWGLEISNGEAYLTYVTALIPYFGVWAGVKAVTPFR